MSMTENEAIRVLKNGWHFAILLEDKQLIDIAIKALEEIQQYRAIGTVEEIKLFFNENRKAGYKHGYSDGYNKAIDEFVEKLKPLLNTYVDTVRLDEVAEQMKAAADQEV